MTSEEARRRLEASTRFEIRAGLVWLRELRWWRAVVAPAWDTRAAACLPPRGDGLASEDRVEQPVETGS